VGSGGGSTLRGENAPNFVNKFTRQNNARARIALAR
jgi:hypothetical protein